jgi:hypothetical protein
MTANDLPEAARFAQAQGNRDRRRNSSAIFTRVKYAARGDEVYALVADNRCADLVDCDIDRKKTRRVETAGFLRRLASFKDSTAIE